MSAPNVPTESLSALISKLEAAEAGSRELDALVEVAIRNVFAARSGLAREHWADWRATRDGWVEDPHISYKADPVTTSLDAALALAERLGWPFWSGGQGTQNAWAHLYERHPDQDGPTVNAKAATPALALCIAILKARVADSASPNPAGYGEAVNQKGQPQ